MKQIKRLIEHSHYVLERVEGLLPAGAPTLEDNAIAWRWRRHGNAATLKPIHHVHPIRLADLQCVDRQKALLEQNTRQFVQGHPANNALLWGSRGTGKSSLIKAVLNEYADDGLRLIEVDKYELLDLPDIIDLLYGRDERFILYSDDLSFEAGDPGYKTLKAALDGSVSALPGNVLIYATSNRRHLLPEYLSDNEQAQHVEGEIHHGEAVEEKISLSERFGLWISFYPFTQDDYLAIVDYWLGQHGCPTTEDAETREIALRWALEHGSRSGRVAAQFVRDMAGRQRSKP